MTNRREFSRKQRAEIILRATGPDAVVDDLCERIRVCRTGDDLDALRSAPEFLAAFKSLPPSHKSMIREAGKAREQGIAAGN